MAHYIDADTLRVKITDLCANANFHQQKAIEESDREDFVSSGGEIYAYAKVLSLINSLQQEQPEVDLEKLGEITRHLIAVKDHEEDMRLTDDEWLLLERIGYPERFNARKEDK